FVFFSTSALFFLFASFARLRRARDNRRAGHSFDGLFDQLQEALVFRPLLTSFSDPACATKRQKVKSVEGDVELRQRHITSTALGQRRSEARRPHYRHNKRTSRPKQARGRANSLVPVISAPRTLLRQHLYNLFANVEDLRLQQFHVPPAR